MPLYSAEIEWTIDAGRYSYGTNIYTIQDGMVMQIDISQSMSGKSYLTFQNRNTNTSDLHKQKQQMDGMAQSHLQVWLRQYTHLVLKMHQIVQ